jgi:hypothetical protein
LGGAEHGRARYATIRDDLEKRGISEVSREVDLEAHVRVASTGGDRDTRQDRYDEQANGEHHPAGSERAAREVVRIAKGR